MTKFTLFKQGIAKPKYRSPLRKWVGKRYFIAKRYLRWFWGNTQYATHRTSNRLPHTIMQHQSTLLRKLKDVDMYLQHNKITNLQLALNQINGIVIEPKETFSFWYLVGNTQKRKGYKEGLMLDNGRIKKGIGGGLCQMGNLIYWMALHTPLTVIERWRHSYDVFPDVKRTLPFGSGATLSYNYVDLQIKNETDQPFQLLLEITDAHLKGAFLAQYPLNVTYNIEERNHKMQGEIWGGYTRHNQIFRQTFDKKTQALLEEELITENHAIMMYQPFLAEPDTSRMSDS